MKTPEHQEVSALIQPADPFDGADYYDCSDPEQLTNESPEEAIEGLLDYNFEPGEDILACIARLSPIKVTAYRRMTVPKEWRENAAEDLFEELCRRFCDDGYDDPDNGGGLDEEAHNTRALLLAAVNNAMDHARIWSCESVGEREYSAAEVEAMMRRSCPSWFKQEAAAS